MADKNMILSADAEEKLLKPIDEYVGKIQAQIDELRVDGSDKVRSLNCLLYTSPSPRDCS